MGFPPAVFVVKALENYEFLLACSQTDMEADLFTAFKYGILAVASLHDAGEVEYTVTVNPTSSYSPS